MRLLALTDFSDAARHAVEYACMLADAQKGQVVIFHVYQVPLIDVEMPAEVYRAAVESLQAEVRETLQRLRQAMAAKYPAADVEIDHAMGFVAEETAAKARTLQPDYIVAGARGRSSVWETLFGSTVGDLLGNIPWPLLIVPHQASLRMPQRMAYASSLSGDAFFPLADFSRLAMRLSAGCSYVHFHHEKEAVPLHKRYAATLRWALQQWRLSGNYYEIALSDAKEVNERFSAHLAAEQTDVVGVHHRHKGLFDILFRKSFTYQLLHHVSIPLVVYS